MKNNEEMVCSVLMKAKKESMRRKRARRMYASAFVCICIVAVAVLGVAKVWTPDEGQSSAVTIGNTGKSRLSLFTVNAAEYKTMIEDVKIPQGIIRVRDVSENTEMEKVFIRREMLAEGEKLGEDVYVRTMTRQESDDAIVVVAFAERLMVIPEDIEQVVDYSAVTQSSDIYGCYINPGKDMETGEIYRGIEVHWFPSALLFDKLLDNPETKLSEIEDTIVITVSYVDGSTESIAVDVTADDEGNIYMTNRGAK